MKPYIYFKNYLESNSLLISAENILNKCRRKSLNIHTNLTEVEFALIFDQYDQH
jgi:hypothetical protein